MAIYNLAWGAAVLPLLGALASFLSETQRRAAQACVVFSGLAFAMAAIVLGVRLTHATGAPYESLITFFTFSPPEQTVFATRFEVNLGVHVDALSASFAATVTFVTVAVQAYALTALRGEPGFRRFFWAASLLGFASSAFVLSPNLFDSLFMWVFGTGCLYLLTSQSWQRADAALHARRVLVGLTVGDIALTLGVLFAWIKFGVFSALLPTPSGQDIADPFSFGVIGQATTATLQGGVMGAGLRTLVVLGILFLFAAMVRGALFPFHVWLTETATQTTPALALACGTVVPLGAYLLARVYPVLVHTPNVLTAIAVAGGVSAVYGALTALAQHDVMRIAVFAVVGQAGLALVALGMGGFSAGVFIAFTSMFFSTLLVLAAGNLTRVFRTRNIHEMGGAWKRMPGTRRALVAWVAGVCGLGLTTYYALESSFSGATPIGGRAGTGVRAVVAVFVIVAAYAMAMAAVRVVVCVCSGDVARRRGFQHERVADVEPALRRPVTLMFAAAMASVLVGLPGIVAIHSGRTNIPGLTFLRFVFFGASRQTIDFNPLALVLALALGAAGAGVAYRLFMPERRAQTTVLMQRAGPLVGAFTRGLFVERIVHRSPLPVLALSERVAGFDDGVTASLAASAADGVALGGGWIARNRTPRLNAYIAGGLVVIAILALISVLAATGHFLVHTA